VREANLKVTQIYKYTSPVRTKVSSYDNPRRRPLKMFMFSRLSNHINLNTICFSRTISQLNTHYQKPSTNTFNMYYVLRIWVVPLSKVPLFRHSYSFTGWLDKVFRSAGGALQRDLATSMQGRFHTTGCQDDLWYCRTQ